VVDGLFGVAELCEGAGLLGEPAAAGWWLAVRGTVSRRRTFPAACLRGADSADDCWFVPVCEQFCCAPRLASPGAGSCPVVELPGGHVAGALCAGGAVVVVVVGVVGVVVVGVVVVGVVVVGVVVVVVGVVVVGVGVVDWAVPAPIQLFSALDMASVLASSDNRARQAARLLLLRGLRCMPGTLGPPPEDRP
jgi:hypothetical protein